MSKFEVLCVTMKQEDFSLCEKMNIESDIVFANQTNEFRVEESEFNGFRARMISTRTKGVGINRNISLLSAEADFCLFADDDIVFRKDYALKIIKEFEKNPKADVIIFNIGCSTPDFGRMPTVTKKTKRLHKLSKNPYGAPRIAFRLSSIRKSGIVFSHFFGGGSIYPSGEDTIWIRAILNSGLRIYLSPIFIGDISYEQSSWYNADIEKKLYGYGAMLCAQKISLWPLYMFRKIIQSSKQIKLIAAYRFITSGYNGYKTLMSYDDYIKKEKYNAKNNSNSR